MHSPAFISIHFVNTDGLRMQEAGLLRVSMPIGERDTTCYCFWASTVRCLAEWRRPSKRDLVVAGEQV
jgi:hypothetical protein